MDLELIADDGMFITKAVQDEEGFYPTFAVSRVSIANTLTPADSPDILELYPGPEMRFGVTQEVQEWADAVKASKYYEDFLKLLNASE